VAAGADIARVRSATVRVRDQFVLARFGRTSRDRYRAAVSSELRELLETPGDRWVSFETFVEANLVLCQLFGGGDLDLCREVGAFGAESNMGFWRSLVYRTLSPLTVLSIAGRLWDHHYQGGVLTAEPAGERGVRLRLSDFPTPHRTHCLSMLGWCTRLVELGRPRRVQFVETACRLSGDAFCEHTGEWD
jgi:hypothetical protein